MSKSLEEAQDNELRIFNIFFNNETCKYRLAASDLVFVDNLVNNVNFEKVITSLIKRYEMASSQPFDWSEIDNII